MADFEDLRLIDLIEKFQRVVEEIRGTKSLKKFSEAGKCLQSVYDFYITAQNPYKKQEELFKNLFSSFNYAAVIVNNAVKTGGLKEGDGELLYECIEIMLKCCSSLISSIK